LSYTFLLHPKVARQLVKMNEVTRSGIRSALVGLQDSPESKGERLRPSDFWKIIIGEYRAIYQIDRLDKSIVVIFVGRGSKVYDEFERML
jgi:mRNA-degrading endonuclease RelE of RelBE toxin-antitoxin system